jgi:hypothetical protein
MFKLKYLAALLPCFLISLFNVSQAATEEEQARKICFEVLHGLKSLSNTADSICPFNDKSLGVWKCTQARVNNGEKFHSAMERCKKGH